MNWWKAWLVAVEVVVGGLVVLTLLICQDDVSVRKPKMDKYLGGNFFLPFKFVTRCLHAEAGNSP